MKFCMKLKQKPFLIDEREIEETIDYIHPTLNQLEMLKTKYVKY